MPFKIHFTNIHVHFHIIIFHINYKNIYSLKDSRKHLFAFEYFHSAEANEEF